MQYYNHRHVNEVKGEFVLRQSEFPALLPIMIVLLLAFAYATYQSAQSDV